MPVDPISGAAGGAGVVSILGLIYKHLKDIESARAREKSDAKRQAESAALRTEITTLRAELETAKEHRGRIDLAGVRAEGERASLRGDLARHERDLAALADRMERQGAAVAADLRPLRDTVTTLRGILDRGASP
jgi:predicted  nucleic acid-binding Zn-ribbon protein